MERKGGLKVAHTQWAPAEQSEEAHESPAHHLPHQEPPQCGLLDLRAFGEYISSEAQKHFKMPAQGSTSLQTLAPSKVFEGIPLLHNSVPVRQPSAAAIMAPGFNGNLRNQTSIHEFVLLGFSNHPELQIFFFLAFSIVYTVTLTGNLLIILVVMANSRLHTPMYFLLGHLSFIDLCYMTTTVPQMLADFLREPKTISYAGCMVQIFSLISCVGSECILLAAMAYDRYVAICHPLLYTVIMNRKVCFQMVAGSWTGGFLNSLVHTLLTSTLSFCGPREIHHFMCDVPPLLELSCTDTALNNIVLHTASMFIGVSPCFFIIISYVFIALAILQIRSTEGRRKAFSTCTSHLAVVIMFFGTALFNYNRPSAGYSLDVDTLVSALYCIVTPMLNPIIYSLRNQEVKLAVKRLASAKRNNF
ncbi:olfactory receptor 5V1-like [Zootoca vivipara]|uniref:olfactory receptor 5V1-like n=1 Tax=Zootoca vivipara TaxID=8524 RepID=UPI00293C0542|nr:olfactory receptor 5V1-like [Zootoca vivipara]